MTAAKSLAYGWGVPAITVTTFDAIAHRHRYLTRDLAVVFDARKQQAFAARYRSNGSELQLDGDIRCLAIDEFVAEIDAPTLFVGNGASAYRDVIENAIGDNAVFGDTDAGTCRAGSVAQIGAARFATNPSSVEDTFVIAPLYVRRPEAVVRLEQSA